MDRSELPDLSGDAYVPPGPPLHHPENAGSVGGRLRADKDVRRGVDERSKSAPDGPISRTSGFPVLIPPGNITQASNCPAENSPAEQIARI